MITPALTLEEQDRAESYLNMHKKVPYLVDDEMVEAPKAIVYSFETIEKLLAVNREVLTANNQVLEGEFRELEQTGLDLIQLKKSNIYRHALHEILELENQLYMKYGEVDKMDDLMHKNAMDVLRVIVLQNHSGMSIHWLMGLVEKLVYMKNLTSITDNPSDWIHHGIGKEHEVWQSERNSTLFSKDGGVTYYNTQSKGAWWARLLPTRVKTKLPKMFNLNLRALYGEIYKSEPHTTARKGN